MSTNATVISTISDKGGVSKTSFAYHYGYYNVYYHHAKVLFIDNDPQGNLTEMFNLSPDTIKKHSILNAYRHDANNPKAPWNLEPVHISKHVDVLTAEPELAKSNQVIKYKPSLEDFVLLHYFMIKHLRDKYDLILIDNHNSMLLNTTNSLVVSDYSIMPINASAFSISGIKHVLQRIGQLKSSMVNPMTNQALITTNVKMIASMIPKNTKSGHQLLDAISDDKHFIGYTYHHELFNRANLLHRSIFKLAKDSKNPNDNRIIKDEILPEFKHIYNELNK